MKKLGFYLVLCILIFSITLYSKKRKVLVEVFTSTTCPPCAIWNPMFDKWYFGYQKALDVGIIKYHVWWPAKGDPYYDANAQEAKDRVIYYGVRSVPSNFIDGFSGQDYTKLISYRLQESSPFEITLDGNISTNGGKLAVTVNSDNSPIPVDTLVLHTVIVESGLHYVGSNKDPLHEFVMRKMLPGSSGEVLKIGQNDSKSFTREITWNSSWNIDNSKVIVFIQNMKTKEILQTEIKTLAGKPILKVIPSEKKVSYKSGSFISNVFNDGIGSLDWKISLMEGSDWFDLGPISGSNRDNFTISYKENKLATNRTGKIQIAANGSIGSPKVIEVHQAGAPTGNWKIKDVGTGFDFYSVYNFNDKIAVAVGSEKTIIKTTDAGKTWNKLSTSISNDEDFERVTLPDANTIVISGYDFIVRSSDGGKKWSINKPGVKQSFSAISFCNSKVGYAFGIGNAFLRTSDRGKTWNKGDYGENKGIRDGVCLNPKTLFAIGYGGVFIKSGDGGKTWMKYNTNVKVYLFGMCFLNTKNGIIVGDKGTILHTSNGGITWEQSNSGTTKRLFSVSFLNNKNGYAVGEEGLILSTIDGGKNWSPQSSGAWEGLGSISCKSNCAFVVGSEATLLRNEP